MKVFSKILWVFFCLIVLVVVIAMAGWVEEDWRGKHDWALFLQGHAARGESVDYQGLIPPSVPDDQNFAMTPLLAPLFQDDASGSSSYAEQLNAKLKFSEEGTPPTLAGLDMGEHWNAGEWKKYLGMDVLEWLKRHDAEMREISTASRRPYAWFPVEYEKGSWATYPQAAPLQRLSSLYVLRACAELKAGQTGKAFEDAETIFRVANSLRNEPAMVPQLIRMKIWYWGLQVVWEGLEARRWSDAQLGTLQADIEGADFLKGLQLALLGKRASLNATVEQMLARPEWMPQDEVTKAARYLPNGALRQMQLNTNLYCEKYFLNMVDVPGRRIRRDVVADAGDYLEGLLTRRFLGVRFINPYELMTEIMVSNYENACVRSCDVQSMTDQAAIACALERYRLAHGQFPGELEKLVPAYLKAIPLDVVNGEQPHYRWNADDTYQMYLKGWDGNDNGGRRILQADKTAIDYKKSDWVWPTPVAR